MEWEWKEEKSSWKWWQRQQQGQGRGNDLSSMQDLWEDASWRVPEGNHDLFQVWSAWTLSQGLSEIIFLSEWTISAAQPKWTT